MNTSMRTSEILSSLRLGGLVGVLGAGATAAAAAAGLAPSGSIVPVAVVLALWGGVGHYWKTQQVRIATEQFRAARRRFKTLEQQLAETQGLVQVSAGGLPYPLAFGGDYALTADAGALLARRVTLCRPRTVLELGSGVSTVLVAGLLQGLGGGRVYSLDHDPAWAEETRRQIAAAGLQECAMVLDASLVSQEIDGKTFRWYELPEPVKALDHIDFLIVDGPPQNIAPEGLPRYPALPVLASKLSENAEIFVDDAKRPAEQETVRLWLARFPGWEAQQFETVPGTCVLTRIEGSKRDAHGQ